MMKYRQPTPEEARDHLRASMRIEPEPVDPQVAAVMAHHEAEAAERMQHLAALGNVLREKHPDDPEPGDTVLYVVRAGVTRAGYVTAVYSDARVAFEGRAPWSVVNVALLLDWDDMTSDEQATRRGDRCDVERRAVPYSGGGEPGTWSWP